MHEMHGGMLNTVNGKMIKTHRNWRN